MFAEHLQRLQVGEAAGEDQFGKHLPLLGHGAGRHQPGFEQHCRNELKLY